MVVILIEVIDKSNLSVWFDQFNCALKIVHLLHFLLSHKYKKIPLMI